MDLNSAGCEEEQFEQGHFEEDGKGYNINGTIYYLNCKEALDYIRSVREDEKDLSGYSQSEDEEGTPAEYDGNYEHPWDIPSEEFWRQSDLDLQAENGCVCSAVAALNILGQEDFDGSDPIPDDEDEEFDDGSDPFPDEDEEFDDGSDPFVGQEEGDDEDEEFDDGSDPFPVDQHDKVPTGHWVIKDETGSVIGEGLIVGDADWKCSDIWDDYCHSLEFCPGYGPWTCQEFAYCYSSTGHEINTNDFDDDTDFAMAVETGYVVLVELDDLYLHG
jgi:hypothetical protein